MFIILIIIINIKQDVSDGRAAVGIEPATFPPVFSGMPGCQTTPAHQAKSWGWGNSTKGPTFFLGGQTKIAKIFCKMDWT